MSSVFGNTQHCEQLCICSLVKNVRLGTTVPLTAKHLKGCMQNATEIKPDIERLINKVIE
jgi:hypothetical protein